MVHLENAVVILFGVPLRQMVPLAKQERTTFEGLGKRTTLAAAVALNVRAWGAIPTPTSRIGVQRFQSCW